jgi:hypothetical protein
LTAPNLALPAVILGKTRGETFRALDRMAARGTLEGSWHLAAKAGDAYLVWGVVPSPLAMKAAENVLALYQGDQEDSPPPRIFYACYAGTHSSVLAASVHLGLLDGGCPVCDLPLFDRRVSAETGVPALVGVDRHGSEVYVLGTGWLSAALEKSLCDLIEVASPEARACMCSVRGFLDLPARLGGFVSRRCRLVWPGRDLIAASLARRVPDVAKAVRTCLDLSSRWKDNEGQPKGEVVWIDGSKAGRAGIEGP